jgi:hypothetical protein
MNNPGWRGALVGLESKLNSRERSRSLHHGVWRR